MCAKYSPGLSAQTAHNSVAAAGLRVTMAELSLINYYCRSGYYRHAQVVASESLKKRANDPTMTFWRAVAMMKEGMSNEAVRELEGLLRRADAQMQLPVKIALLYSHRSAKFVDNEAVARLEDELMNGDDDNAPDRARLTAAQLFYHLNEVYDAKKHVQAILRLQPNSVPALTLSGWLELSLAQNEIDGIKFNDPMCNQDPSEEFEAAGGFFERAQATAGVKKDLEASMGQAKLALMQEKHKESLDHLSQVIGTHAWFLPALVEKSLVLLAMGDWEQSIETAQRVLQQAESEGGRGGGGARAGTIDALRVCALYSLSQESDIKVAASKISELSQALDRHEPMNAPLYHKVARPFARLAGRAPAILSLTLGLTEKAVKLAPNKAEYAAEHAYQLMLLDDYSNAQAMLKRATAMEEGSDEVMPYLIKCQILSGDLAEAEMQLQFSMDMASTPLPEMALNEALVTWRRTGDAATSIAHLDRALQTHMSGIENLPHDVDYFWKLNPDFLLEISREYLRHCTSDNAPGSSLDDSSPAALLLSKASKLLQLVAKQVPGLLEGQLLLAKAHFLRGDFDGALRCCVACNKVDPSFSAAALLHAQILLKLDKFKQANAVMEQVLSHNFGVREAPLFHLVKARLLYTEGEYAEAEKLLNAAIKKLPRSSAGDETDLSLDERCSMHTCLVEVLLALGKLDAASAAMSTAVFEFSGTSQEGKLTITNAKVEVEKGEVATALSLLRNIPAENPHYHSARKVLAELYLEHRNDKRMYAACHEEMAAAHPSVDSYVMLGEAYMRISDPERAIAAFEQALTRSPNDSTLASRIGKVLVSTHEYVKAIEYYSDAVATDPSKTPLRYELANLFFELKKFDQAHAEIDRLIEAGETDESAKGVLLDDVFLLTKTYLLLARVRKAEALPQEALDALSKAKANQSKALTRVRGEGGGVDMLGSQQDEMADVCLALGAAQESMHEHDAALSSYRDGLKYSDSHEACLIAVAKMQLRNGELDAAQQQVSALMASASDSTAARMLLADILLSKSEWDAAIYHFEAMLSKSPSNYAAIAKLLQLLRRSGRLAEAPKVLKDAERSSARAPIDPGFRYCQGLLARFQNNPRAALRHLNMARRDGEYGESALSAMIEIYLNPENETNWDELNIDAHTEPSDAVRAADRLLREIGNSPRREVLACYTLMAYKGRSQIEKAAAMLLELLTVEKDFVPALVCLSQAYLMLKQAPKARNHLKRVAKIPFAADMVDDFERGWLMLADVYIGGGKYDLAEELCWRCLASNKSCAKAWEFLGVVKEKEMSYKDAASHYEKAWLYENEASATVGYKLSFNYFKAKKYVEAIDVCHKVLQQYPDYPMIRADVLDKAREAIKP